MRNLGTLNQGRRVNKSSAILNKKNLLNLLIIVIIVQANVLKSELGCTGGHPRNPGYKKVSYTTQFENHKNNEFEKLLIVTNELKKKRCRLKTINVGKLISQLIKRGKGAFADHNQKIGTQISLFLSNNLKVIIKFSKIDKIDRICRSSKEMLSLTIYQMLLRQNVESNPGMINKKNETITITTFNCNGLRDKNKLKRLILKISPIVKREVLYYYKKHI